MTQDQLSHSKKLSTRFKSKMLKKYKAGVKEHKTNLWDLDNKVLLDNAIEEVLDLAHYLETLKDKL